MIICICHRVSDRQITQCAREGMCFDGLQFELGVATQCGQCECKARAIHAQAKAQASAAQAVNTADLVPA